MSDLLKSELAALCEAEKNVNMPGGQERLDRQWKGYRELKRTEQRERAFGHPEDIPPVIERTGISVDDNGDPHDVYERRA